jgi:hypothetical protein
VLEYFSSYVLQNVHYSLRPFGDTSSQTDLRVNFEADIAANVPHFIIHRVLFTLDVLRAFY